MFQTTNQSCKSIYLRNRLVTTNVPSAFFVVSQLRLIVAGADVIAVLLQAVPRPRFRTVPARPGGPPGTEGGTELTDLGTLTMGCFSSSKPCAAARLRGCDLEVLDDFGPTYNQMGMWYG